MRKSSDHGAGDAARISGNIYAFRVPDSAFSASAISDNAASVESRNGNSSGRRLTQSGRLESKEVSFDLPIEKGMVFESGAVAQPVIPNVQASLNRSEAIKRDDAIPSFFTRAKAVDGNDLPSSLAATVLEKVSTRCFSGRARIESVVRLTRNYCSCQSEALFCCAGAVAGIFILGTDAGIKVSRASEQAVLAASQAHLRAAVRPGSLDTMTAERVAAKRGLSGGDLPVHATSDAISATLQSTKATAISAIAVEAATQTVVSDSAPAEPTHKHTAQVSVPDTAPNLKSVDPIGSLAAVMEQPVTIKAINAPEVAALAGSNVENSVPTRDGAEFAPSLENESMQKSHKAVASHQRAIVKAAPERTPRASPKKRPVASAKRPHAASGRQSAISKLGATIPALKKKSARPVKSTPVVEPSDPIVAVRTLEEAMARQYGLK